MHIWIIKFATYTHCTWSLSCHHFTVYHIYITIIWRNIKILIWDTILTPRKSNQSLSIYFRWVLGLSFGTEREATPKILGKSDFQEEVNFSRLLFCTISGQDVGNYSTHSYPLEMFTMFFFILSCLVAVLLFIYWNHSCSLFAIFLCHTYVQ